MTDANAKDIVEVIMSKDSRGRLSWTIVHHTNHDADYYGETDIIGSDYTCAATEQHPSSRR